MDLEVDRGQLRNVRLVDAAPRPLEQGEARLRVDSFALTSNNITYAVFGDAMRYWDFFPANPAGPDDEDVTWGRVPVWGFADVIESTVDTLVEGTRVYGYLPMSHELIVRPGRFDDRGFSDTAAHRAPMAGAYNRYVYCAEDPIYDADREPHQMVLYPLFFTSFMIDDVLDDTGQLGGSVIISSASSKTAIGAAHLLSRRDGVHVIGLTSARNADFVRELGCYHQVVTYDALDQLPAGPAAYVDIAGDSAVTRAVHEHFTDSLTYSMIVGGTHWDGPPPVPGDLPGPKPEMFFAPTVLAQRIAEWGPGGFDTRLTAAWESFLDSTEGWLDVVSDRGAAAAEKHYRDLLEGRASPKQGVMLTLLEA